MVKNAEVTEITLGLQVSGDGFAKDMTKNQS